MVTTGRRDYVRLQGDSSGRPPVGDGTCRLPRFPPAVGAGISTPGGISAIGSGRTIIVVQPWGEAFARLPSRFVDLALAVTLALVDVATLLPYRSQLHPLSVALLLVVAQNLPLFWRRARPEAVFFVIGSARLAYDLNGLVLAPLPLGLAIAVYTVAERCSPPARKIVGALLVSGLIASQLGGHHNQPYDAIEAVLIFATAWMAGVISRARRAHVDEVEGRALRAEAERDRQVGLAAAEERQRIARELHDIVAHHVSLMAVQAEAAMSLLPAQPDRATESVEVIAATARQALTELRRLLGVLRGPPDPDAPPGTAPAASLREISGVLERIREAGLEVGLDIVGTPCGLTPSIDLTAFRIVQEALTNALRHAHTSRAAVTLSYEPGFITVSVDDPGEGGAELHSPNGSAAYEPGFGLAGITERVTSCGGNLSVGPTAAGGFAVTARLPTS